MKPRKMGNRELYEERKRCMNSPHYFFTRYVLIDGKPVTTNLEENEFNELFKSMISENRPFNSIKLGKFE